MKRKTYSWGSGKFGCREYQGSRYKGYGRMGHSQVRVHRWVMEQWLGRPLLEGEVVRHTCDNPPCFLFEHLMLGTQADNVADMIDRDRANFIGGFGQKGESHPRAVLTERQVHEIRAIPLSVSSSKIGKLYGVTPALIRNIRRREIWTHI